MVELFRFIQQEFVVPDGGDAVDLTTKSAFQIKLRDLIKTGPYSAVRVEAEKYIDGVVAGSTATLVDPGLARLAKYTDLRVKLLALPASAQGLTGTPPPTLSTRVSKAIKDVFAQEPADLVASQKFKDELAVSSDVLVAVKITTRFDRVDAPAITAMRQVVAFIADFVAGRADPLSVDRIRALLERPVRIPEEFFPRKAPDPQLAAAPAPDSQVIRRAALATEQAAFQQAYDTLMAARPSQLAIHRPLVVEDPVVHATQDQEQAFARASAVPSVLGVAPETIESMNSVVQEHLRVELGDAATASVQDILDVVKRRWLTLAREVEPSRVPKPARVYRLGANLFAIEDTSPNLSVIEELGSGTAATDPPPDFSHAITRPVGVGDLQVVRQELIGYVPADISHIENVLPGELLRKTTKREETSELTLTSETETVQSNERDGQTTDRNELATEAQQEAGQQSSTTQDQTSTSNYGRLVENSKTDYARSVTDRAVNKLTQSVKQQRVQREKKVYTEETVHQLDNSHGISPLRGIYQWVDKKYKTKVFNYGKRLLYDVVVPEPAAFLIQSLESAAQPENFQLTRPAVPTITPGELNAGNYLEWATRYGVTGAVTPPPAEFVQTVAETQTAEPGKAMDGHYGTGSPDFAQYYTAFKIRVPENYTAISGYVQHTNHHFALPETDYPYFEFYIGEDTFVQFRKGSPINQSFSLKGETGDLPVTMNTYPRVLQFNFAIGVNCRRTDKLLEKWQLDTHAKIVAGYQRQYTEYLDQLGKYQTAVRTQMSLATAFAHDSTTERQELKKAFIHLLMSEHFGDVYYPAPDPGQFPPDPRYVKQWGAVVAFFERAFEWEHLMYIFYPYFWGRRDQWSELVLIQDIDPQFEAFLKAGAARVVLPVRPGFEAALAHFHETGDVWMGEEIPDMFSDRYVSIIAEIKARNAAADAEVCVAEWEVRLPTTLVMLKEDAQLPQWSPAACLPGDSNN
ncbi:hypothetical protein ACQPZ2_28640 [Nocardia pseudovaccinii]|uniref:hypothetical protein n=1 Tax=Nocardia pseudovaccinii TaxID=189540 RepID=UPI003D8EEEB6